MAIINRFTRLFTADVHAVLDRLEEPEVLLKQAIREMEDQVHEQEQTLRQLIGEQETLRQRRETAQLQIGEANEQLDLCFQSGHDGLAKTLLRRRLAAEKLLTAHESKTAAVETALRKTHEELASRRQRLADIRDKASYVCDQVTSNTQHYHSNVEPVVTEEDIEIAFLKEKQKRNLS